MATQEFIITLPDALAEKVRIKVATGEYDSADELIEDGLEALFEDQAALASGPAFDAWVREELLPSIAQYRADPASVISSEDVAAHFNRRRDAG